MPAASPRTRARVRIAHTHCARAVVLAKLEELQMRDTLRMFNGLVERCFSECVHSFRSKAMSAPEEKCVNTCANKFLKHSVRRHPTA